MKNKGYSRLWGWFGLSYASFLVLPRNLMHHMSDEWQDKMAALLEEYDETFDTSELADSILVQRRVDNKFAKWDERLLNYRRPRKDYVEALKIKQ